MLHEVKKYPASELEFFNEGSECVIKCRQVLKWSYCVGYYAAKYLEEKDINLFKFWQSELEEYCEKTH